MIWGEEKSDSEKRRKEKYFIQFVQLYLKELIMPKNECQNCLLCARLLSKSYLYGIFVHGWGLFE
jgi:hypothetical protein